MPTKAHNRRRSSIDQVIDLLADLEETQIALLLDDFNHTTPSNVPVNQAIALFEQHATKTKRKSARPSSPVPVMTLQAELERRHSKRISSAPEPRFRPKATSQSYASRAPTVISPIPASVLAPEQEPSARPDRPSLVLSPPVHSEHPKSSNGPPPAFRPRSYKRISRPMILSPTATAELHHLLRAFFNEASSSSSSSTPSPTPSPTTPNMSTFLSPFSRFEPEPEPSCPGLDLLEPSPTRTPSVSAGRSLRTATSMSSIFEVLRSQ